MFFKFFKFCFKFKLSFLKSEWSDFGAKTVPVPQTPPVSPRPPGSPSGDRCGCTSSARPGRRWSGRAAGRRSRRPTAAAASPSGPLLWATATAPRIPWRVVRAPCPHLRCGLQNGVLKWQMARLGGNVKVLCTQMRLRFVCVAPSRSASIDVDDTEFRPNARDGTDPL